MPNRIPDRKLSSLREAFPRFLFQQSPSRLDVLILRPVPCLPGALPGMDGHPVSPELMMSGTEWHGVEVARLAGHPRPGLVMDVDGPGTAYTAWELGHLGHVGFAGGGLDQGHARKATKRSQPQPSR